MPKTTTTRRETHYKGHVQGVGFRYTTRNIASRYQVTGFVRNLPDGRVQLVVEGDSGEVDAFLDELAARMQAYIKRIDQDSSPAQNEFTGFDIRF